jgi:hypothetical protein
MAGLQPHLWPDANSSLALGSANDQGPAFASCGYHIIQSEPIPRAAPYMPPTGARTSTQRFVRPSNSGYPLAGRSHGRHVFRPMRASARQAEDRKPETDADVSPAAGKGQTLDRQPRRLRGKGSTVLPAGLSTVRWLARRIRCQDELRSGRTSARQVASGVPNTGTGDRLDVACISRRWACYGLRTPFACRAATNRPADRHDGSPATPQAPEMLCVKRRGTMRRDAIERRPRHDARHER